MHLLKMMLKATGKKGVPQGGEAHEIFLPIPGGWGKMGDTHIHLAVSEDVLSGALRTRWKLRIDKNAKTSREKPKWRSAAE
jgi:hypothetical protein